MGHSPSFSVFLVLRDTRKPPVPRYAYLFFVYLFRVLPAGCGPLTATVITRARPLTVGSISALSRRRRRRVHCAGMGVPVLKLTAPSVPARWTCRWRRQDRADIEPIFAGGAAEQQRGRAVSRDGGKKKFYHAAAAAAGAAGAGRGPGLLHGLTHAVNDDVDVLINH